MYQSRQNHWVSSRNRSSTTSTDDESTAPAIETPPGKQRGPQRDTVAPGSDGRGSVKQETVVTVRDFLNAFDRETANMNTDVVAGPRWALCQDRLSIFLSFFSVWDHLLLDFGSFLSRNKRSH